jgi:crotonobetainyl-CoA:carnitine CoA-transferase CaiB-like acyl-CoA transferase
MGPDVTAAALIPGGIPYIPRESMANPISNLYRTADGRWIYLAMLQADRHWPELCEALGRPELIEDERFASAALRAQNLAACMGEIEAAFASRPLAEWRERLAPVTGVWAVVQNATELLEDPQVVANGYVAEVDYGEQRHKLVVGPAQFDGAPPTMRPAPGAGEHTDEILQELGNDWDRIVELKVAGVVN